MINTMIARAKARKNFYRGHYHKGLMLLIVLLATEIILTLVMLYVVMHQEVPAFYASSSDGILTRLKSMPEPNRSGNALLQ